MHATSDVRVGVTQSEDKIITVGALAEEFRQRGHGRVQFDQLLEDADEQAVIRYCGDKYQHGNGTNRYQRAGTVTRTITTILGESDLSLSIVKDTEAPPEEQTYFRPIEDHFEFNGQKHYQQCISVVAATVATKNSYRDATYLGNQFVSMVSPATTNRRVMEYGPQLQAALDAQTDGSNARTVIPDGTKVRSQGDDAFHEINVTVTRDGVGEGFQTDLLDANANDSWRQTATDLEDRGVIADDAAVVSDGERSLAEAFRTDNRLHQYDLVHLPRSLGHKLWEDDQLPLEQRQAYAQEVCHDAFYLKNSVALHASADEWDAIEHRIEATRKRLARTRRHLSLDNCTESAAFLRKWEASFVRFAEAAMDGRTIPWTSNAVERTMGTVSKRCKNQWMQWTARGIDAMLTLTLVNSIHPELYEEFEANQIGTTATSDLSFEVKTGGARGKF